MQRSRDDHLQRTETGYGLFDFRPSEPDDPGDSGSVSHDENRECSLIQALPAVLGWKKAETKILALANANQAAFVRKRIELTGKAGSRLSSKLFKATHAMWRHIELAPQVYRLVCRMRGDSAQKVCEELERFFVVERRIEEGPTLKGLAKGSWSALGDVRVGEVGEGGEPELPAPCYRVRDLMFAPLVRETVIDGNSPFHKEIFRYQTWKVETHKAKEFRAAVDKVSSAVNFIRSVSEPFCTTLDKALRVVSLARTPENPEMTRSCSHSELVGLVGFTNLHSQRWDIERVVDALVHEAIHSLIAKIAHEEGLFSSCREAAGIMAVSPWSGRQLKFQVYIHSCFVWFGMWNFWKLASEKSARGLEFAERARKGFEGESCLRNISTEGMAILEPQVVNALRSMTEEVVV